MERSDPHLQAGPCSGLAQNWRKTKDAEPAVWANSAKFAGCAAAICTLDNAVIVRINGFLT